MFCLPISNQEDRVSATVAALLCSREVMFTLLKMRGSLAKFDLQVQTLQGHSKKYSLQRRKHHLLVTTADPNLLWRRRLWYEH